MKKILFRYFYGFIESQQRFINRMAEQGWRLIRTGRFIYEFESCPPGAYQYCIDFVGQKSYAASNDYRNFLEEMGYRVMTKPINTNVSLGKIRFRPWGSGWGKISTTPGTFNKELLIVEKENDGQPFELHTTSEDKIAYYRMLRRVWATLSIACAAFAVFFAVKNEAPWRIIALGIIALIHLFPALQSHRTLMHLKWEGKVSE